MICEVLCCCITPVGICQIPYIGSTLPAEKPVIENMGLNVFTSWRFLLRHVISRLAVNEQKSFALVPRAL